MRQKVAEIIRISGNFCGVCSAKSRATGIAYNKKKYETPGRVYRAIPSRMETYEKKEVKHGKHTKNKN
jgi:hypothetical protein